MCTDPVKPSKIKPGFTTRWQHFLWQCEDTHQLMNRCWRVIHTENNTVMIMYEFHFNCFRINLWCLSHTRWSGFVHWLSFHGGLASHFFSFSLCLCLSLPCALLALCSSLFEKQRKGSTWEGQEVRVALLEHQLWPITVVRMYAQYLLYGV